MTPKDSSDRVDLIKRHDEYSKMWWIFKDMTDIRRCDRYSKMWQIFEDVTDIRRYERYSKMWQIFKDVTDIQRCDRYSKIWQVFEDVMDIWGSQHLWFVLSKHFRLKSNSPFLIALSVVMDTPWNNSLTISWVASLGPNSTISFRNKKCNHQC